MFTLSETAGGLTFFELVDDDVVYSKAHIAKVWTLEPTALADARQALVNIRAGQELKDEFEGKTAAEVQQAVLRLEETLCATVDSTGQPQPETESAIAAGGELEQVKAQLAQSQAQNEAKDAELAELRARLAGAASAHEQAAEGVPPL